MNALLKDNLATITQQLRKAGPYLLLELLLPGGTLFALLLFLYRNPPFPAHAIQVPPPSPVVAQALVSERHIVPQAI